MRESNFNGKPQNNFDFWIPSDYIKILAAELCYLVSVELKSEMKMEQTPQEKTLTMILKNILL